jgi:hypothetical protein
MAMVHPDEDWRACLHRDGYAVFPGLCPQPVVRAARAAIDRDLRINYDPLCQAQYDSQSYCPGLRGSRPLMALLLRSGIAAKIDEALGFGRLIHDWGQIAIRWARNSPQARPPEPHIDGLPTPFNGLPPDILVDNFTALVGIYLSPVRRQFAGNFTVWPSSHHVLEQHFRDRGPAALQNGMPQIRLGRPLQLTAEPGDVVLCHYGLAHSAADNLSNEDRYAVYFRLWLKEIDDRNRWQFMTRIWQGWRI